jgi:hypothetical protein
VPNRTIAGLVGPRLFLASVFRIETRGSFCLVHSMCRWPWRNIAKRFALRTHLHNGRMMIYVDPIETRVTVEDLTSAVSRADMSQYSFCQSKDFALGQ